MISWFMPSRRIRILFAAAMAHCGLLSSLCASAAEGDPFSVIAGITMTHDDNVFRAPAALASPVVDKINSSYAGLIFDTNQSLQHVHLELVGNDTRYEKQRYLNNNGSRYQASWDGWLGQVLKIDAGWNRSQSLAGFADFRSTIKNIVVNESSSARVQYLITPEWSLLASVTDASSTNGATTNSVSDSKTRTDEFGVRCETPLGNSLGLIARTSIGRYPNRQIVPGFINLVDNSYRQQDIEGSASWAISDLSRFDLHIAQTSRDHNDVPKRNFKGVTGSTSWDWSPTPITAINLYLVRDLGATEDLLANYAVTNSVGIAPRWMPTPDITVQARIEQRKRSFGGDPKFALGGIAAAGDTTRTDSLSIMYTASRLIQLSISARHEVRDSSDPALPYISNVVSLSAQLMF